MKALILALVLALVGSVSHAATLKVLDLGPARTYSVVTYSVTGDSASILTPSEEALYAKGFKVQARVRFRDNVDTCNQHFVSGALLPMAPATNGKEWRARMADYVANFRARPGTEVGCSKYRVEEFVSDWFEIKSTGFMLRILIEAETSLEFKDLVPLQ